MATDTAARTIERELAIKADPQAVWNAITDAREITRWFAPEATATPGEGGRISLTWADGLAWAMPIVEWVPDRRLVLTDEGAGELEAAAKEAAPTPSVIRYEIEPAAAGSVLRLTHTGFGHGAEWDEIYDGTCNGWTFELRSLRYYLENHRGEDRRLAMARVPVSAERTDAWATLTGPACLGLQPSTDTLREGDAFTATPAVGDPMTGRVLCNNAPVNLGGAIDQLNRAILRATVERWCGASNELSAFVWLSSWGADPAAVNDFQSRWQNHLEATFSA